MDAAGKDTLDVMDTAVWYNKWLYDLMSRHLKGDILEVGAGTGNFTKLLAEKGKLTVVDINEGYIKSLRRKYKGNISVGFGDIEKAKYYFKKNKRFDSIVCLNVLEHIKNDKKTLENMNSLLTSSGNLILLVPAHMFLYSQLDKELGHYRRYSTNDLGKMVSSAGFEVIKLSYFNWWAAIGWYVFLKLNKSTKMPRDKVGIFDKLGKFLLWPEKYIKPPFGLSVYLVARKLD